MTDDKSMFRDSWRHILLEIAVIFAAADGHIDDTELERIVGMSEHLGGDLDRNAIIELCPPSPVNRLDEIATGLMSIQHRRLALRDACIMCDADGVVDDLEMSLLHAFRTSLGLSEEFLNIALEWSAGMRELKTAGKLLLEFGEDAFEEDADG